MCDVMLPLQQNFWISTIVLDRDVHFHCGTMEEKNENESCRLFLSAIKHRKVTDLCQLFSFFFLSYLQDHGLLKYSNVT